MIMQKERITITIPSMYFTIMFIHTKYVNMIYIMGNKEFVISNGTLESRFENSKCRNCNMGFKMNDSVHTHTTRTQIVIYHKKCWDSMLY